MSPALLKLCPLLRTLSCHALLSHALAPLPTRRTSVTPCHLWFYPLPGLPACAYTIAYPPALLWVSHGLTQLQHQVIFHLFLHVNTPPDGDKTTMAPIFKVGAQILQYNSPVPLPRIYLISSIHMPVFAHAWMLPRFFPDTQHVHATCQHLQPRLEILKEIQHVVADALDLSSDTR